LGKAYTYLRMLVYFAFLAALGLQQVAGQACGGQTTCATCVQISGCAWSSNRCVINGALEDCLQELPSCISRPGQCGTVAPGPVGGNYYPPAQGGGVYSAAVGTYPVTPVAVYNAATVYPTAPYVPAGSVYPTTTAVYPSSPVYPPSSVYPYGTIYPVVASSAVYPATPVYPGTVYPAPVYPTTPAISSATPPVSTVYPPLGGSVATTVTASPYPAVPIAASVTATPYPAVPIAASVVYTPAAPTASP